MNPYSNVHRVVGMIGLLSVTCMAAAVAQPGGPLGNARNQNQIHGPAIRTERGNYSFRGMQVPIGKTRSGIKVPIVNAGDVPLSGVSAVTHGDFVVTGTSCSGQLPAGREEKSQCAVSVAFRPTAPGLRTGDLTITANGALSMVVPLIAGTPIDFGSIPFGETSVQWVRLFQSEPLTGSVTGPFAMVLQPWYLYGSIDGVDFAPSSSGTPSGGPLYLGVQFQAAAYGSQTGTVTLSDGTTYALSASVADGVQLSPASVDFQDMFLKTVSGTAPFVLANGSSAALTIGSIQATAPFASTNNCGRTLAPGASCTIDVTYNPTATGAATGQLTISTSSGSFVSSLAGTASSNPQDVSIDPDNFFLTFTQIGNLSPPQTITVKNLSTTTALEVHGFDGKNICSATLTSNCYQIISNNCSALSPLAFCQIQMQYLFGVPSGNTISNINLLIDSGIPGVDYTIWTHEVAPTSDSDKSLVAIPASLTFPSTEIGQASDEQLVTILNNSTQPWFVTSSASYEFSVNSGCAVMAPGDTCLLHVRSIPVGAGHHGGSAVINGVTVTPDPVTHAITGASVQGYGIPTTALASPAYDPLNQPVYSGTGPVPDGTYIFITLPVKNTGTTPLVLNNISIRAMGPAGFSVDPSQCDQPLASGAECALNLTLDPENCPLGPEGLWCYDASHLNLESNAVSSPDSYLLEWWHVGSLNWSPPLPLLTGPFPVEFGRVQVGTSAVAPLSFVLVPAISISGSVSFQLVNECASLVGTTTGCTAQVIYAPTKPGFDHGSLRLVSTAGISTVTLAGYAIPAQLTASPSTISFPDTLVYQNPPDQTVSITNTSAAPLALGIVYQPKQMFQVAGTTCGTSLAAQATCTITVSFTPYNNVGSQTSSLRFSFGVDDGVETIPIIAPVTSLTVSPASVDFGSVFVGQAAATQTFTVQNIGTANQNYFTALLQGAALSGTAAADFTITANTCTAWSTLAGTQTCSITVQFKPSASGVRNGVLTIATDNAGYTSAVLVGTGDAVSTGCDVPYAHHHDKDADHEHDCDCDKHHHRDRRECRTNEHRDKDHEHQKR